MQPLLYYIIFVFSFINPFFPKKFQTTIPAPLFCYPIMHLTSGSPFAQPLLILYSAATQPHPARILTSIRGSEKTSVLSEVFTSLAPAMFFPKRKRASHGRQNPRGVGRTPVQTPGGTGDLPPCKKNRHPCPISLTQQEDTRTVWRFHTSLFGYF